MLDRRLSLGEVKDVSFWVNLSLNSDGKLSIPSAPHGRPHLEICYRNTFGPDAWLVLDLRDEEKLPETEADVLAIYESAKDALYERVTKSWG